MDFKELKKGLKISDGAIPSGVLSLPTEIFTGKYDQPVEIKDAKVILEDPHKQRIQIEGSCCFLNVDNAPTVARFWITPDGELHFYLRIELIGKTPAPDSWRFSNSFSKSFLSRGQIALDDLVLYNAYFLFSGQDMRDSESGVPLVEGINFVAKVVHEGALSFLPLLIESNRDSFLYGEILLPESNSSIAPHITLHQAVNARLLGGLEALSCQIRTLTFTTPLDEAAPPLPTLTGMIRCKELRLSLPMDAQIDLKKHSVILRSTPHNSPQYSLDQLAKALDIPPIPQLQSVGFQDQLKGTNQVKMTELELKVDYSSSSAPTLTSFAAGAEVQDWQWEIWPDRLSLSAPRLQWMASTPFDGSQVTLQGVINFLGVPFQASAKFQDDVTVVAEMVEGHEIVLGDLTQKLALPMEGPEDLRLGKATITVHPGHSYSIALSATNGAWRWWLPVGSAGIGLSNLSVEIGLDEGAAYSILRGQANLGGVGAVKVVYKTPGDLILTSEIPQTKLKKVIDFFSSNPIPLPEAFNLTLKESKIQIKKEGLNYSFNLGTELSDGGSLILQAKKEQEIWGVAVGMAFPNSSKNFLHSLDFFQAIESLADLESLNLVLSSFDASEFQFPNFETITGKLPSTSMNLEAGVIRGVNLYVEWIFNDKSREIKLLGDLLGLSGSKRAIVQIGENPSQDARLFMPFTTKLQGHRIQGKVGIWLQKGAPAFFLSGTTEVEIQNQPRSFSIDLLFVPTGALISASMTSSQPINFEVFKIGNPAFFTGINWGGVPSGGIAGNIYTDSLHSSVACFFDSTDPSKSMLAGSISDASVADLADTFCGERPPSTVDSILSHVKIEGTQAFELPLSLAEALDKKDFPAIAAAFLEQKITLPSAANQLLLVAEDSRKTWYVTDVEKMHHYQLSKGSRAINGSVEAQLYCVPQETTLGAIRFPQGFYVAGALDFFGYTMNAQVEIQPEKGIAAQGQLDPITVIDERLFNLHAAQGKGGPMLSFSTYYQSKQENPQFRAPHCYINGEGSILGLQQEILASVTTEGIKFSLEGELVTDAHYNLAGWWNHAHDFGLTGSFSCHIALVDLGVLGELSLPSPVTGEIEVEVNGSVKTTIRAEVEWDGSKHTIAAFQVDYQCQPLKILAEILTPKLESLLSRLLSDPKQWIDTVLKKQLAGIKSVASVLKNHFDLSSGQASGLLKTAGFDAEEITKALKESWKSPAKDILKGLAGAGFEYGKIRALHAADFNGEDIAKAYKELWNTPAKDLVNWMQDAGYGGTITSSLRSAGYAANDIAKSFKDLWNYPAKSVLTWLTKAGFDTDRIGALKYAGYSINQITEAFKTLFHPSVATLLNDLVNAGYYDGKIDALKAAGYPLDEIANGYKTLWDTPATTLYGWLEESGFIHGKTTAMAKAGYTAIELAEGLRKTLGSSAEETLTYLTDAGFELGKLDALKAANYDLKEIVAAFRKIRSPTAKTLYRWLDEAGFKSGKTIAMAAAGYNANELAQGLKQLWNTDPADVLTYLSEAGFQTGKCQALASAGYAADQVVQAYKDLWDTDAGSLLSWMDSANYSLKSVVGGFKDSRYGADEVGAAFKSLGRVSTKDLAGWMKSGGYAVEDTAGMLKNVFHCSSSEANSILKAGYNLSDKALKGPLEGAGFVVKTGGGVVKKVEKYVNPFKW